VHTLRHTLTASPAAFACSPAVPPAGPFRVPGPFGPQVMEVSYALVFAVNRVATPARAQIAILAPATDQVRLLTAYFESN
jgi:hypothetical protein